MEVRYAGACREQPREGDRRSEVGVGRRHVPGGRAREQRHDRIEVMTLGGICLELEIVAPLRAKLTELSDAHRLALEPDIDVALQRPRGGIHQRDGLLRLGDRRRAQHGHHRQAGL